FHADPHPANIVVASNNQIVFVDFGACGTMSSGKRTLHQEMVSAQSQKDIHGMARAIMGMLEPLPHIDLHQFEKEVEFVVWTSMCKMWSKHSPWYDKTSSALWLSIFDMTRRYEMPVNLDTVRLLRANMLYDSLAVR